MSDCFRNDKEVLMKKIQQKREEMIKLASLMGLAAKETIQCSQELDQLLNCYQQKYSKPQLKIKKEYQLGKTVAFFIGEAAFCYSIG